MQEIKTPAFLTLSHTTEDQGSLVIMAAFRKSEGRYIASSVSLAHAMDPVTATSLRGVRLRAVLDQTIREALQEPNTVLMRVEPVRAFLSARKGRPVARKYRSEPTDEHLETAAVVMKLAQASGAFVVRAVESSFGIDYASAKSWVGKVRRRGLV